MMQKVSAAFIMSLGVALAPAANPALAGSTRAMLPVGAWGSYGGVNVGPFGGIGPYGAIGGPNGGLSAGPFSGLYVDVYRPGFTCTYDIPWDWAHRCPPIPTPPEPPLAPAARAPSCVPQNVTVPGSDGKDQTITMVRC